MDGLDALELGCGACQFGIKVAMRGANVKGLDFSANQLAQAGPNMKEMGVRFPLVRASAEELPNYASQEWARDFPAEHIWKVRKA